MQQETTKKRRLRRTWWFWLIIAVVVLLVLAGGAVLADWLVYYGEVHAGITVNGVYLRGMDAEEATVALQRLVESAQGPVTLMSAGKSWVVAPTDVGRVIDVQAAVDQAMAFTRKGDFFENVVARFRLYRHGRDLPLVGAVDSAKLKAIVTRIAAELHVTPRNASLAMRDGAVEVIAAVDGREVNTEVLTGQVESLFLTLRSSETLEIPLIVTQPEVREEDNQEAERRAQIMMSRPITLKNHDKEWTLAPQQIASWMSFHTDHSGPAPVLVPYLSEGAMAYFLIDLAKEVYRKPVDAGLKSVDGTTITVIPAVVGEDLDSSATAKALNAAAAQATGRTLQVAVITTDPEWTTQRAQAETFTDELASFTEKYTGSKNRQVNVAITTKYATNILLAPGQEYNFDVQIGPRTEARGYKLAPGIVGPNTLEDVLGGGICQVSTTMFNAVFFAGLKVTERHNHSIYISHYPKGRDATVTAGGKNLRFVNDTAHFIWVKGTSDGITTTIAIYGTSDGRKVSYNVGGFYGAQSPKTVTVEDPTLAVGKTKVIDDGQTGRKLKTTRTVTLPNGNVLHNDTWTSVWPMYPKQIAVGTKPAAP